MCITAYSLTMACIWTSVLVVIMYAIQKNKRTLQYFGINNLLILYGFCIIRMLVPIELPITKTVPMEIIYNTMTRLCTTETIGSSVLIGDVILMIWGCGTVISLCLLIKDYRMTKQILRVCTVKKEGMAYELLRKLQEKKRDKRKIEIYTTPYAVPMEIGILHPAILLPDREYQEQDLYYIMKHEYTHILNHDSTVKLLLNLWRCIFWWNPIAYLLCNNIEDTLELKCDFIVVGKSGKEEKAKYLSAILHTLQNVPNEKEQNNLPQNINALYKAQSKSETLKRFRSVSEYAELTEQTNAKHQKYIAVMLVVYTMIFCVSYGFVFQSKFDPPIEEVITEENIIEIRQDNTFLREKGDRYEIIYEGQCIGDVGKDSALSMQKNGFEIR
ncbi:MAG: M56 family metallopeptidase [Lachnospiraceae bacterium]|nr:M56 family metallopeptidase [Lachnospiraceae bacterium]